NERTNSNWGGYIIAPADADSIITVGAVDSVGELASFSSHGPTYDGRTKPEVVAQGVGVACASPGGPASYAYVSGTSLSTPLVAGSAALLLEAHPTWRPEDVRIALMATASRAHLPDNDYGWGIPNVLAALDYNTGKPSSQYTLAIGQIYPNPFPVGNRSFVLIPVSIPAQSSTRLDVYNIIGQHVVQLNWQKTSFVGPAFAIWDGGDDRGRRVPSGIYFVRLATGNKSIARRVTVVH
ncbi:MAG: S8 family peptidase, partial [Candidatus Brocadiales bacterium]|nr:S8 family peptidase [Candidatus Bathyanammoxibius sp.]